MFKSVLKGLKAVASAEGIGTVLGIVMVLVILSYFHESPDMIAAKIRTKVGG